MNPRTALGPMVAVLILIVIAFQTNDALHRSGTWGGAGRRATAPAPDPYSTLESRLAAPDPGLPAGMRDPFSFGRTPEPIVRVPRPVTPAPPPMPQLTAILTGEEARALLRYRDHDYTVQAGDVFAEFKVLSISADQVVLDRGGQRLVLQRPTRGEP